jgi:hypothetical protein
MQWQHHWRPDVQVGAHKFRRREHAADATEDARQVLRVGSRWANPERFDVDYAKARSAS